jgi:hypothetical protein
MNYVIIIIVFTVLGLAFGALIYFVDWKISTHKNKFEDSN